MPQSYFSAESLDDAMKLVFEEILRNGTRVEATRGGNSEITGVLLEIHDPRARISRTETRGKPFSCLGELCWYLSGSNKANFISYYIDHYRSYGGGEVSDAYGPRLLNWRGLNQLDNITSLLTKKPHSRQAIIQFIDPSDLEGKKDVPCTCTAQFLIRSGTLNMLTFMRSNDAVKGLPHDVFCFTMLQEILARRLGTEVGTYRHIVGSLHVYDSQIRMIKSFQKEGWQSTAPMPPMPLGDPSEGIKILLEAEQEIRLGTTFDDAKLKYLDPYWADLIRLLLAYRCKKNQDPAGVKRQKERMSTHLYSPYLDRISKAKGT